MAEPALRCESIGKVYPGVRALDGVDFDVVAGAVNVLIGENGAGKSTLMKIIAGVERPSSGRLLVDDREAHFAGPADAARAGVGIVFQELSLFGNLSITENLFVGRELTRFGQLDRRAQARRAAEVLGWLKHDLDPGTLVGELTVGQQQIVEIARALAQDARILILDEPTSALSAAEVEILFGVIAELKQRGVALVYISHRLEELTRIGDYVTVLRDGRVTGCARMAEVDVPWIVRQMTGRESRGVPAALPTATGAAMLRVREMALPRDQGGWLVDHVSLEVRAGEIVGIYGLLGAGRSELFDCIMGARPDARGAIEIDGAAVSARDVAGRIRCGLALVPEDRRRQGFVSTLSVAQNLTLASLGRFATLFHVHPGRERRAVRETIDGLGIKVADPGHPVGALSGGNQQKVVIGKALLTQPRVLLMDEPTRGIDVGAKAELYRTMRRLAGEGLAVLFATSELEEVLALSDRVGVMCQGRLTAMLDRAEATEEAIVGAASPNWNVGEAA